MKYFNKFLIGGFIHDTRKGKIGMILANSDDKKMVIKWLSGKVQEVPLVATNLRDSKLIRRMTTCKAIQLADFTIEAGLPSRVLKIVKSNDTVDVKVESLAIPDHHLNEENLVLEILRLCKIAPHLHTEVKSQHRGDTFKTLVRCWL